MPAGRLGHVLCPSCPLGMLSGEGRLHQVALAAVPVAVHALGGTLARAPRRRGDRTLRTLLSLTVTRAAGERSPCPRHL